MKARVFILVATVIALFTGVNYAASTDAAPADTSSVDFKQWGLVAIQDNGRRKPVDTFAKETLIRLTGRSTYTDKTGRKWQPNDFVLSAQLETHDWKNEPMVLVSFGKLVQTQLQTLANAYAQGDGFNFSRATHQLRENLRALSPSIYPQDRQLRLEYFYNHFEGFYRAIWCYGIALVILIAAYLRKRGRALQSLGVAIALLGLAFQASGILMRCMIAGRPPVTNMYESIIWVSFAVSLFGMIFFARYRAPVYLLAALPVTLIALLLVHQMPIAMPSSIDPLVPVLRDNFWLTIHVLTITLSYAAFALAMGFGHILLWRYARNPATASGDAPMHFWLYRVLQLGVLLLAAGTILGGVWANYSWGRFWGWDPKETWALIALLCYILTLHGRLAGWWTEFGLVVASVVCFLAVLMAWYGVNFVLGKGLHSYGFGIGGETYVAIFVIADLLFVAFAIWRYRTSKHAIVIAGDVVAG